MHILKLEYIEMLTHIDLLLRDFTQGTAITISNGSYFPVRNLAAGASMDC